MKFNYATNGSAIPTQVEVTLAPTVKTKIKKIAAWTSALVVAYYGGKIVGSYLAFEDDVEDTTDE